MNRASLDRLTKVESAIAPPTRQVVIFDDRSGSNPAEAQIAAKTASGEIGPDDRILIMCWQAAAQ